MAQDISVLQIFLIWNKKNNLVNHLKRGFNHKGVTDMAHYKVEICGVNTAKLPLLTNSRKQELFERIEKGDKAAREEFIYGNLRLVLSIIQKFSATNENIDDLFQIGCIGLIKALDNFDRTMGVQFSTYACPMITGEVRRYLRDSNQIRVSRSLKDMAYKAMKTKEELTKELGRDVTLAEIAKRSELDISDVIMAFEAMQNPISLYEPVYTEGGDTLYVMDQVSDKKNKEDAWIEEISLNEAIKNLPEREKYIVKLRFYKGKTQSEVARMVGISQAQVSRLEKNAIKSMKKYLGV